MSLFDTEVDITRRSFQIIAVWETTTGKFEYDT